MAAQSGEGKKRFVVLKVQVRKGFHRLEVIVSISLTERHLGLAHPAGVGMMVLMRFLPQGVMFHLQMVPAVYGEGMPARWHPCVTELQGGESGFGWRPLSYLCDLLFSPEIPPPKLLPNWLRGCNWEAFSKKCDSLPAPLQKSGPIRSSARGDRREFGSVFLPDFKSRIPSWLRIRSPGETWIFDN